MMKTTIFDYAKTEHFMLRQWDRSIEDNLLKEVLPHIRLNKKNKIKKVTFVLPSFLKKKGASIGDKMSLVLISRNNPLITGYWCDHPNYLFDKEKNANYQIIY